MGERLVDAGVNEHVMSEVQYLTDEGWCHSDLPGNDREHLHACLDEWLDMSNGTGFFYIGDWRDLKDNFAD